ncbi:MarR family transcriptional regulator [Niallia oryzisoli]|uniref:MarR family transcriptional regulator n=1 Tax=Niallia oryzisoli TaxID=1737571 RepID=UPI003734C244
MFANKFCINPLLLRILLLVFTIVAASEDSLMIIKQQMVLVIRALYFCMAEQWSELGKKHNISPAQQHILFLLSVNPSLTPTQISQLGCWHISTVTRLLKPLENNGLISISPDTIQRKCKKVSISEEGKKLITHVLQSAQQLEHFPFPMDHLSETEIVNFLECGHRILEVLKGKDFYKKVINAQVEGFDYQGS